jgi:hypothetical protein
MMTNQPLRWLSSGAIRTAACGSKRERLGPEPLQQFKSQSEQGPAIVVPTEEGGSARRSRCLSLDTNHRRPGYQAVVPSGETERRQCIANNTRLTPLPLG